MIRSLLKAVAVTLFAALVTVPTTTPASAFFSLTRECPLTRMITFDDWRKLDFAPEIKRICRGYVLSESLSKPQDGGAPAPKYIGNLVYVYQMGDGHEALIYQNGSGQLTIILQDGSGNVASVTQNGNHNTAVLVQDGTNHSLNLTQNNDNNVFVGVQTGDGKSYSDTQNGGETDFVVQ